MISTCIASAEERRRAMPADERIPAPVATFTHAITIRVAPRSVWPWIAQLGAGRGGWYAYDALDNGGRPSAEEILPEHQAIRVGDLVPALPGATRAFRVAALDPGRDLVLAAPAPDGAVRLTWELLLEPVAGGWTRLLARARLAEGWLGLEDDRAGAPEAPILLARFHGRLPRLPAPVLLHLAAAGHRVMEARMLRGIKRRAERPVERVLVAAPRERRLLTRLLPRAAAADLP